MLNITMDTPLVMTYAGDPKFDTTPIHSCVGSISLSQVLHRYKMTWVPWVQVNDWIVELRVRGILHINVARDDSEPHWWVTLVANALTVERADD